MPSDAAPGSQRLTNDDFRKLLMTPRSTPANAPAPGSIREAMANSSSMPPPKEDKNEARRKKKSYYAKLKKQEDNKMAELAEKYRDRASERRQGVNPDYQSDDPVATAQAYRAVAPDLKSGFDAAERRRQMIQESKFLGGDMEHTHLVKGLDYALLQKVRSEIQHIEQEQEQELERLATKTSEEKEKKEVQKREEDELKFKTKIGKSIYHTICSLKSRHIERSEIFVPGRMAYVIDLGKFHFLQLTNYYLVCCRRRSRIRHSHHVDPVNSRRPVLRADHHPHHERHSHQQTHPNLELPETRQPQEQEDEERPAGRARKRTI
jgi:IK cytokine